MRDWRTADLSPVDQAICEYVEKLTRNPAGVEHSDLLPLRDHGLTDQATHDICQVTAYFAYINRIADGLGIDLEPEMDKTAPWK